MKTANTASLVHLNDVVCLTVSNNISHMDDFEQRFNILQNKVNNAPLQFLPQIETSFRRHAFRTRVLIGCPSAHPQLC